MVVSPADSLPALKKTAFKISKGKVRIGRGHLSMEEFFIENGRI